MDMGEKVGREIEILSSLQHPHIIRMYEVIEAETDIFVAMEYVPGGELFDYLVSHGRLEVSDARFVFQQIISGIEYIHAMDVVHRDLKPENILLDEHNRVRIADFGLSNNMLDGMFLRTSCGSPNYAAPEVISGQLYAGAEVDVWSCGVILYALLCGSLPFDDEMVPNLFRKIKSGAYTIPSYLSEGTTQLIRKMLTVDPIHRISVADIRKHPWTQCDMPKYLQRDASYFIGRSKNINDQAIKHVVKMQKGYKESELREALSMGTRLVTKRRYRTTGKLRYREMVVTYHTVLKDMENAEANAESKLRSESKQMAPRQKSIPGHPGQSAQHGSNSPLDKPLDLRSPSPPALTAEQKAEERRMAASTSWSIGFWSSMDAAQTMIQLLQQLRILDMEWKMMTPYQIRARSIFSSSGGSGCCILQLYSAQRSDRRSRLHTKFHLKYILDIVKIGDWETLQYLDFCTRLVEHLTSM